MIPCGVIASNLPYWIEPAWIAPALCHRRATDIIAIPQVAYLQCVYVVFKDQKRGRIFDVLTYHAKMPPKLGNREGFFYFLFYLRQGILNAWGFDAFQLSDSVNRPFFCVV